MELVNISTVSRDYNISTRTLRYYEELGLIKSRRIPDYSYRVYDEETLNKIRQIIILRKLSLSLSEIKTILKSDDAKNALEVFAQKIDEINRETESLNAIKSVIKMLVDRIKYSVNLDINLHITNDAEIVKILDSLCVTKKPIKEKKFMEDIKKVSDTDDVIKQVRIIYLPPATVASSHYIGSEPEDNSGKILDEFIDKSNLASIKPDFRIYGFNNPNPQGDEEYGYEFYVTIPDDFDVGQPLAKKCFQGGLYAAYCIKMGDFHKWQPFFEWVMKSNEYDYDVREPLSMGGSLEEHINAFSYYKDKTKDRRFIQLDLLIPIKKKEK